jgi:hypothetical protein
VLLWYLYVCSRLSLCVLMRCTSTITFSGRRREWGGLRGSDERWGSDRSRRTTREIASFYWDLLIHDVLCWWLLIPDM